MQISYTESVYHATDKELISNLQNTAQSLNKSALTIAEYDKHGKYNSSTIIRRFGSWNNGLLQAQLNVSNRFYSDNELFDNLLMIWKRIGRQPSRRDLDRLGSPISYKAYERRFGKWSDAIKESVEYYNNCEERIDFNAIDDERLPNAPGRVWYEADFDYIGGYRNDCRLLYSNDGLIFITYDHYATFYEIGLGVTA